MAFCYSSTIPKYLIFLLNTYYFIASHCTLCCLDITILSFVCLNWLKGSSAQGHVTLLQPKSSLSLWVLWAFPKLCFHLVYWCSAGQASSTAKPRVNVGAEMEAWKPHYIHIESSRLVRFQQSSSSTLLCPWELISFVCNNFLPYNWGLIILITGLRGGLNFQWLLAFFFF